MWKNIQNIQEDKLNYSTKEFFTKIIKEDEKIIWSGKMYKVNVRKRRQERKFVLTNYYLYNFGSGHNFFKKWLGINYKRKIDILKIKYITISRYSNNFILHIPNEYDYYLSFHERNYFLLRIFEIFKKNNINDIIFNRREEINLFKFLKLKNNLNDNSVYKYNSNNVFNYDIYFEYYKEKEKKLKENINSTKNHLSKANKVTEKDFDIIKILGKGSFGKVFLVEKISNQKEYALKVIRKADVIKQNTFKYLKEEKKIMENLSHPFILNLNYFFSNDSYIFFAMKYKNGGELYKYLKKVGKFKENIIKFYASQIVLGLEYLKYKNIVYRDLKPENILIDENGNSCLADFGISKIVKKKTTNSFVGTSNYIAPEVILKKKYSSEVDIWSLGVLLYEMACGCLPFQDDSQDDIFYNIINESLTFKDEIIISRQLKSFISSCLKKNPEDRIGYKDFCDVKKHKFFKDIDWNKVIKMEYQSPLKVVVNDSFINEDEKEYLENYRKKINKPSTDKNLLEYNDKFKEIENI